MDCMTDAKRAHRGSPGQPALDKRSAGVTGLSPPADSGSKSNFKQRLIIWGVIANLVKPSFYLEWTLFLFTPNKRQRNPCSRMEKTWTRMICSFITFVSVCVRRAGVAADKPRTAASQLPSEYSDSLCL
ncbi:Hypothetical predicted protein [Xyrichtys novacula]|uniref:Uncharacterized protein n=1 Tax=Xyrichtys novacula TaxID=13765 RepID=A0AAV1GZ03_XYRNO|nr:Hypothetical predicted protein [Xyrichtys novacula]